MDVTATLFPGGLRGSERRLITSLPKWWQLSTFTFQKITLCSNCKVRRNVYF